MTVGTLRNIMTESSVQDSSGFYSYALQKLLNQNLIAGGGNPPYFPSANFSAHRQLTHMSQYSMERGCPEDSKKYRLISVCQRWAEQFTIEVDVLNRRFWNFQENCDFGNFHNFSKKWSISITNCSAHRPLTEMSLYFLELSGHLLYIEYWLISVSSPGAEKFAI